MEGILEKKISMFRGFKEKWFVLTEDGFLQYFEIEDEKLEENIRDKIYIVLSTIKVEDEGKTFRIATNSGETYILRGESKDDISKWIETITLKQEEMKHKYSVVQSPLKYRHTERQEKPKNFITDIENTLRRVKSQGPRTRKSGDDVGSDMVTEEPSKEPTTKRLSSRKESVTIATCLMVAAIDFGSAASGCAFSLRSSYKLNPLDVHSESLDGRGETSLKAPTVVLLDPDGKFVAFGKKAQEKFAELAIEDKDKNYFYFERFKMQLYTKKILHKDMKLKDIKGREMKATDVFAICIEYIKDTVFKKAKDAVHGLKEENVRWILTVPAIWNESARQFMISAAEKAGISRHHLTLVLEPEAAAMFCKHIELKKKSDGKSASLEVFEPGVQFLVVDLGGGTVDITTNEVMASGQLREVYNASGGPWGGNMINQRIWKLIRNIFTNDVVDQFIAENTDDHLDLLTTIEQEKMRMAPNRTSIIRLPEALCEKEIQEQEGVQLIQRKLHLRSNIIEKIFESSIKQVCTHLERVLARKETQSVKSLLLVGGYSSCEMLKTAVMRKFNSYTVICPISPEMIVLNGAVIMGHMDRPVVDRLARFHYGLSASKGLELFGKSKDISGKRCFNTFIVKGQPILVGDDVADFSFVITDDGIEEAVIDILISEDDEAPLVISDETCTNIGRIKVRIPEFRALTKIKMIISCEETEFNVIAIIESTGHKFSAICSFLQQ